MPELHSKLIACHVIFWSLASGACIAFAAPPEPPQLSPSATLQPPSKTELDLSHDVTLVPVEFRVSVVDLEKQMLRDIVQKIDPMAKAELPVIVKGNIRDL